MRIVIFADYDNTATLVAATLDEVARRRGCEVVAVYTCAARLLRPRRLVATLRGAAGALVRGHPPSSSRRLAAVCRRRGVPLMVVPDRDPNAPAFLDQLKVRWAPDVALSYWSTTIFGDDWLDTFRAAVNFHDGRLPDHRGVAASSAEVYDGLERGGFTFHHIDKGIDTGNILVEGAVPIAGVTIRQIIDAKLTAAGLCVGEVLDRLEAGDPGREPEGDGSYMSMRRLKELDTVADPRQLDRAELQRRMDAFGAVTVPLAGERANITRLARGRKLGWPRLELADGPVTVSRIVELPALGYLVGRRIRRSVKRWRN